jgi:hypothetical protein
MQPTPLSPFFYGGLAVMECKSFAGAGLRGEARSAT